MLFKPVLPHGFAGRCFPGLGCQSSITPLTCTTFAPTFHPKFPWFSRHFEPRSQRPDKAGKPVYGTWMPSLSFKRHKRPTNASRGPIPFLHPLRHIRPRFYFTGFLILSRDQFFQFLCKKLHSFLKFKVYPAISGFCCLHHTIHR